MPPEKATTQPDNTALHYQTAEGLFAQAGDPHGVATSVENHAWVRQYAGDHDAATAQHHKALDIYQRLGARRNWAITLRGMALAEVELGQLDKVIAHLAQAWKVFREPGLDLDAAMVLNGLGEAHAHRRGTAVPRAGAEAEPGVR